ncbi:MAG: Asp23/Gls24 family envelope stress response protein [Firmicutes bacterium]|nr:Asp23/Gls24 family envelope stress response protein [Bacillota bacterium]
MDSIVHFENERFIGRTRFHSGLLNNIVVLSVQNVDGVDRLSPDVWKFRRIFRRSLFSGVDVTFELDGVVIDVSICVKYGYSAADVSYRVQECVLAAVGENIDGKIKNVNVRISSVAKPACAQPEKKGA